MKTSVILFALLTGCYGAAPPRPVNVSTPAIMDGAEIEVHSETKTTIERVPTKSVTCPQGHVEGSPSCVVTTGTALEPVTRTTTQAQYAGAPITYGQFLVMTDPNYHQKLGKLEELSHVCQRANVPRYAGMALMLGGLLAGPIIAKNADGKTGTAIFYGGLGTGAASFTLGYFTGGRQCNEARALFREVDMSARMTMDTVSGGTRATEMQILGEQFNARLRGRTSMQMRDRE